MITVAVFGNPAVRRGEVLCWQSLLPSLETTRRYDCIASSPRRGTFRILSPIDSSIGRTAGIGLLCDLPLRESVNALLEKSVAVVARHIGMMQGRQTAIDDNEAGNVGGVAFFEFSLFVELIVLRKYHSV